MENVITADKKTVFFIFLKIYLILFNLINVIIKILNLLLIVKFYYGKKINVIKLYFFKKKYEKKYIFYFSQHKENNRRITLDQVQELECKCPYTGPKDIASPQKVPILPDFTYAVEVIEDCVGKYKNYIFIIVYLNLQINL